jgi:hypothetical protein
MKKIKQKKLIYILILIFLFGFLANYDRIKELLF